MSIDDATTAANDRLADRDDMIVCVNVDKFYGDFSSVKGRNGRRSKRVK